MTSRIYRSIPNRAFRYHDFDVAELSFNIRTDRNIRGPADLKGKPAGVPEYQQTANVWTRIFKRSTASIQRMGQRFRTSRELVEKTRFALTSGGQQNKHLIQYEYRRSVKRPSYDQSSSRLF